jgi:hypothetical protein
VPYPECLNTLDIELRSVLLQELFLISNPFFAGATRPRLRLGRKTATTTTGAFGQPTAFGATQQTFLEPNLGLLGKPLLCLGVKALQIPLIPLQLLAPLANPSTSHRPRILVIFGVVLLVNRNNHSIDIDMDRMDLEEDEEDEEDDSGQMDVAAKWSMVKDEPVKDLLGNINKALIQRLLERKYGGDKSAVPTIDYFAVQSKAIPKILPGVTRTEVGNLITFKLGSKLPETESWFQTLAGSWLNWLFALVSSPIVVQGTSYVYNALRRILALRAGQKVVASMRDHFLCR